MVTSGVSKKTLPFLKPMSKKILRLRWDPTHNVGLNEILVEVESESGIEEIDISNNVALKKLNVRSKPILKDNGHQVYQTEEDEKSDIYRLQVFVKNDGETDARGVVVDYFRKAGYKDEDLMGEVFLDFIPAGSQIKAELVLKITPEQIKGFKPYYRIYRKGSNQRVLSGRIVSKKI